MGKKRKTIKPRNPVAAAVTAIRHKIVPDKSRAMREAALDEMVAESERLGLYDHITTGDSDASSMD